MRLRQLEYVLRCLEAWVDPLGRQLVQSVDMVSSLRLDRRARKELSLHWEGLHRPRGRWERRLVLWAQNGLVVMVALVPLAVELPVVVELQVDHLLWDRRSQSAPARRELRLRVVEEPRVEVEALGLVVQRPERLVGTLRSSRLLAGLDDSNNPVVGGRIPHLLA